MSQEAAAPGSGLSPTSRRVGLVAMSFLIYFLLALGEGVETAPFVYTGF